MLGFLFDDNHRTQISSASGLTQSRALLSSTKACLVTSVVTPSMAGRELRRNHSSETFHVSHTARSDPFEAICISTDSTRSGTPIYRSYENGSTPCITTVHVAMSGGCFLFSSLYYAQEDVIGE